MKRVNSQALTFSPIRKSQMITFSTAPTATNRPTVFLIFRATILHLELAITPNWAIGLYFKYCFVRPIIQSNYLFAQMNI